MLEIKLGNGQKEMVCILLNPVRVSIEGVSGSVIGKCVDVGGAYEVLLGMDWLRATRNTADFANDMYTLGARKVCVRQRGRQLEILSCTTPSPMVQGNSSEGTKTSSNEDGDAEEALQGLLAQFGLESDSGTLDDENKPIVARLANLPRIKDDLDKEWLEEIHFCPTILTFAVSEIQDLLVSYRDCFALSFVDLERTPIATFHTQLKEDAVPVYCGAQRRFAPKELNFMKEQLEMLESVGFIKNKMLIVHDCHRLHLHQKRGVISDFAVPTAR